VEEITQPNIDNEKAEEKSNSMMNQRKEGEIEHVKDMFNKLGTDEGLNQLFFNSIKVIYDLGKELSEELNEELSESNNLKNQE
jgi:hypothetical protein